MKFLIFLILSLIITVTACQSPAEEIAQNEAAARNKNAGSGATAPDGRAVFRNNCVLCHGADGKLGLNGAKDLTASILPIDTRIQIITNGKNLMTPFKALLSEAEIKAVATYTLSLNPQVVK